MKFKINNSVLSFLETKRIYFRPQFHNNGVLNKEIPVKNNVIVENYSRIIEQSLFWGEDVSIGAFSYISLNSYMPNCDIGRFCSIGMNCRIMGEDHPLNLVTTSTWAYGNNISRVIKEDYGLEVRQNRGSITKTDKTIIGNDVWIADNVTIKRGVNIGDGAVIAANSIVTKDVPEFSIVAGNPARVKKYRFHSEINERIKKSQWWNICPSKLATLDFSDISMFDENLLNMHKSKYNSYNLAEVIKNKQ